MIVDLLARLRARLVNEKANPGRTPQHPSDLHGRHSALAAMPKHASVQQLLRLTTDYSGHVRQAALERLNPSSSPEVLRAILLRLNDWVPQVRHAARAVAWTFLSKEYAEVLITCLPDILALKVRNREDHTPFLLEVQKLLTSDDVRPKLLSGLQQLKGVVARFAYQMLLESSHDDTASIYKLAASHGDCSIRLIVARACAEPDAVHVELLHQLTEDSHPSVRVEALRSLWEQELDDEQRYNVLSKCLLDRSAGVRDLALWYVRKTEFNLPAFMEERAKRYESNEVPVGFIGLLEQVVDKRFLAIAQRASESASASARLAGLAAYVRLNSDSVNDVIKRGMVDASAKVHRFALKQYRANRILLSAEENAALIELLLSRGYIGRALSLIGQLSTWEMLQYYLEVAQALRKADDAKLLTSAMNGWLVIKQLSFIPLTAEQRKGFEGQLALVKRNELSHLWPLEKIATAIANTPS